MRIDRGQAGIPRERRQGAVKGTSCEGRNKSLEGGEEGEIGDWSGGRGVRGIMVINLVIS